MENSKAWWVGCAAGMFVTGVSFILREMVLAHADWGYQVITVIFQISFCLFMFWKVSQRGN